jgi:hypothetical protein
MFRNGDNSTRHWHSRHNSKQWEERRTLSNSILRKRLEMAGLTVFSVLLVLAVSSYGRRLNAAQDAAHVDDMNYFVRVYEGKFVVGPTCKPFYISGEKTLLVFRKLSPSFVPPLK